MSSVNQPSPFQYDAVRRRPMYSVDQKARVTGLCKLLSSTFYPDYRFSKRMLAGGVEAGDPRVEYGGRALGKKIDRQLFVHVEHRNKLKSGAKKRKADALDPYARKIWDFLVQDYEVSAAQVGVGALLTGNHWLFTAVDLVCRVQGKPNEVVLVEVKCKQSSYYEKSTGLLKAPYTQKANHQLNQDQLQLGLTKWLYEQTFPSHRVVGAMIVRAHDTGVHHYPLQDWVLRQRGAAVSRIIDQLYSKRPVAKKRSTGKRTTQRPRKTKKTAKKTKTKTKKPPKKANSKKKTPAKKRHPPT